MNRFKTSKFKGFDNEITEVEGIILFDGIICMAKSLKMDQKVSSSTSCKLLGGAKIAGLSM